MLCVKVCKIVYVYYMYRFEWVPTDEDSLKLGQKGKMRKKMCVGACVCMFRRKMMEYMWCPDVPVYMILCAAITKVLMENVRNTLYMSRIN